MASQINAAAMLLRTRVALTRAGAPLCVAGALCLAGVAAWAWVLPHRSALQKELAQPLPQVAPQVAAPPPPSANQNLAGFYDVLGEKRYTEQQVKVLFDLAARSNLTLSQGEYKTGYDKASGVSTYQILLPVKGPYGATWRFAMEALRAMPFAALDEVAFRRDSITDPMVEARLRFTLYLKDAEPALKP